MRHIFAFIFVVAALVGSATSFAASSPWNRQFRDIALPTQEVFEHDSWTAPAAASASVLKSGAAITNGATTTISSFSAQPDVARNITLTPTGTTANVGAGTAVVTGTNMYGAVISENFSISSTQSTATTGNKAFRTVTSVVFPAATGTGVTLSIGAGSKLGVRRCLDSAGQYVFSIFNSAYETTRGTMASNSTGVESNTFIPNGSMDGTKPVELYYVQNFRCGGQ